MGLYTEMPALLQAIEAGHLKELSYLCLDFPAIQGEGSEAVAGAEALAKAILIGCPKLHQLKLLYLR